MRSPRGDLPSASAFLLGFLLLGGCGKGLAPSKPNLVLVTLDTVRADRLGAYGYAAAETPALDRLAAEGLRFAAASSAVPLTLPSHATLLSGLLPPHHGLRNNGAGALPEGTPTLATALAAGGYRTGAFIAAFVLDRRFGLSRGFEVYDDEVERGPEAGVVLEAERPGSQVMDRALAWLGRDDDPRPFFLWVHLYDAHAPYAPPPAWRARFPHSPYDGEIAAVDEQVGRLLAELDRRGLAGSTVVAVVADHGEGLGEHGEQTHGLLLYESTLRVPLLVRAPGVKPPVVAAPVGLVDLAPTLAGLVGRELPPPAGGALDGRDLSADLHAGREPGPADVYAETRYPAIFGWSPLSSLRRRDLKYIAAPRPELYDLRRDPRETADLAASGAPEAARGFAARLAEIESGAVAPGESAAPDAETRSRLASLGYAAGGESRGGSAPGRSEAPDPKRMVQLFQRFERANAQLQDGEAGALTELEALVGADPDNPVFRGKLGQAWRERGELERAVPLYQQAAAAAPEDPEAWYNLAATLQEAGRIPEARQAIETALGLDDSRPEAHNTLGIVHLAEERPEEARRAFEKAAELDPRNAHALNNLGNVLRALRRYDEAERAYRRSSALAPRYAEPWNGLGALEVERDRPGAALPYFERALELAPAYHEVRLNRAIAREMAGNAPAAVAAYRDFLAATEGDPRFAETRRVAEQLLARLTQQALGRPPAERR